MADYVCELTGVTPSFVEGPISFDSFVADNTRRDQLIGRCALHWKDGVKNTFERLGTSKPRGRNPMCGGQSEKISRLTVCRYGIAKKGVM